MAPRQPGTSRRPQKPPREAAWTAPPVRCPSGRRRYTSADTASAHYRVSRGGSVVVACAACGGWHHERAAKVAS